MDIKRKIEMIKTVCIIILTIMSLYISFQLTEILNQLKEISLGIMN